MLPGVFRLLPRRPPPNSGPRTILAGRIHDSTDWRFRMLAKPADLNRRSDLIDPDGLGTTCYAENARPLEREPSLIG